MSTVDHLSDSFVRGLEADLRALCVDAKRKNPQVKEAAERVILLLKQADTPELAFQAADNASVAFCAACEPPTSSSGATSSTQVKVVLRAVSCLHKLLTHRTLSSERLPEVLDALQRLAVNCIDDTITLKVLQSLLSLLTVRSYAKTLSEDDLARAFSLLFILKTSRPSVTNNPASNALSAISQISAASDSGVIEQTSKAAFRQASSDLFGSAADAAVQTAVRMQAPSGDMIPLEDFPSEARAAYRFFADLCHIVANEPLEWLVHQSISTTATPTELDVTLALEVIDDGLANNIALFAAHPVFTDLLSSRLCPVLHRMLQSSLEKQSSKSLFALTVTVIRNYWRNIMVDALAVLNATLDKCREANFDAPHHSWPVTYSLEALRCIFRLVPGEQNIIIDFVHSFELGDPPQRSVTGVIDTISVFILSSTGRSALVLPATVVMGSMKPFVKTISNNSDFLAAAAVGLYLDMVKGAEDALRKQSGEVAKVLLQIDATEKIIGALGRLIELNSFTPIASASRSGEGDTVSPSDSLANALGSLATTSHSCDLLAVREHSFTVLSGVCSVTVRNAAGTNVTSDSAKNILTLFDVLFSSVNYCQDTLGASWTSVVDALEPLDDLIHRVDTRNEQNTKYLSSITATLKPKLDQVFESTRDLKWTACHDLISALVKCSRQKTATLSKAVMSEDFTRKIASSDVRIFGILSAENAILNAFQRKTKDEESMPSTLWELLTGHLTSVCADSPIYALRMFSLNSLTRIACSAISSSGNHFVQHEKVVTPFLDLFNSTHADVRSGSLSSLHTILGAQGEHLEGDTAWRVILNILTTAAGSKAFAKVKDTTSASRELPERSNGQRNSANVGGGDEMISEGFKVVQVIADDFLSSLARNSLTTWLEVLRLYSRQEDDLNVSLTSIGLLWRTADFVAKSDEMSREDWLWVGIFENLKDVSVDESPEIRNCAVKTLTGALSAHSFRLSARAWSGCVERALLPLLEQVMKGKSSPSQAENNALGNRGKSDSQVMWHHSRDTPRKQWNETRVLALGGVAKVLRSAMPRLAVLQDEGGRPLFLMLTDGDSDGLWRKMLRSAGVAAASRDREVAVAGASALLELLTAAGYVAEDTTAKSSSSVALESSASAPASLGANVVGKFEKSEDWDSNTGVGEWIAGVIGGAETAKVPEVPERERSGQDDGVVMSRQGTVLLWEAVWSALTEAIGGIEVQHTTESVDMDRRMDTRIVDEKALEMLAEGLIESRKKLANKFTTKSSKMLVQVLMYLAAGSGFHDVKDSSNGLERGLTEVQEATLKGLKSLSFGNDAESWNGFMHGILSAMSNHQLTSSRNALFTRRILETIQSLYAGEDMPEKVKKGQLKNVLPALGGIMLQRRDVDKASFNAQDARKGVIGSPKNMFGSDKPLWQLACDVVIETMCHSNGEEVDLNKEWTEFAKISNEFLFTGQRMRMDTGLHKNTEQERRQRECYDVRLVNCLSDGLRRMNEKTALETKQKLVGILARGAEEGERRGRRRLVRNCQKELFSLENLSGSGEGGLDPGIVEEAGRRMAEMCDKVLGRFVSDGVRSGRCPLAAERRAEAVFLLNELKFKVSKTNRNNNEDSRKQVLGLYPTLCECVDSKDAVVRSLARDLLDETSPLADGTRRRQGVLSHRAPFFSGDNTVS